MVVALAAGEISSVVPDEPDAPDAYVCSARPCVRLAGVGYVECVGYIYAFDSADEITFRHAEVVSTAV